MFGLCPAETYSLRNATTLKRKEHTINPKAHRSLQPKCLLFSFNRSVSFGCNFVVVIGLGFSKILGIRQNRFNVTYLFILAAEIYSVFLRLVSFGCNLDKIM